MSLPVQFEVISILLGISHLLPVKPVNSVGQDFCIK